MIQMALRTAQVTVSTSAVELRPDGAPTSPSFGSRASVAITADADQDLYVGGSGVTTSTGFKVPKDTSFFIVLNPGERIYGIAGGSGTVQVIRQDF
jgi:hypothetical protein